MAEGKQVLYFRVSTAEQGRSGLGLDAQREQVHQFLNGGEWMIVSELVEIESGSKSDADRPELAKALRLCRIHNARLVVAKLDRLSRSVSFISRLMDSKVKFVAVDMPEMDSFTVHIFAALAERERKLISQRTRDGLRQAKLRGVKLGSPELNLSGDDIEKGRKIGLEVRTKNARLKAVDILEIVEDIKDSGITTFKGIAEELTRRGIPTPRNKANWQGVQVKRLYERANRLNETGH